MNHKKALKKILKWAGSLLLSSLFTAPVIFILIICGVVIALFGKSSTLDLCQYFEHKKLKGYADFFNSSSSFCCGVI